MIEPIKSQLFDKQLIKKENADLFKRELVTRDTIAKAPFELQVKCSIAIEEYYKLKYLLENPQVKLGKRTERKLRVKANKSFKKYLKIKSRIEMLGINYE